jgi:chromosome partitioning protein
MRFLGSLDIPLIATLRDTQSYVRSAEVGLGVCEMPQWQVQQDLPHWREVLSWLAARPRNQPAVGPPTNLVSIERPSSERERSAVTSAGMLSAAARD